MVDGVPTTVRGTSNRNERGSAESRRRRKVWLVDIYRADVDAPRPEDNLPPRTERQAEEFFYLVSVPLGSGTPACRCYRCGDLLTIDTVTVDRIKPGCKGGTYARTNIRPACGGCNSETGGALSGHARRNIKR